MLKVSRLEVISTGARRRGTLEEKQRIVAESYGVPRQVSATARRNGLSASQRFTHRLRPQQDALLRHPHHAPLHRRPPLSPRAWRPPGAAVFPPAAAAKLLLPPQRQAKVTREPVTACQHLPVLVEAVSSSANAPIAWRCRSRSTVIEIAIGVRIPPETDAVSWRRHDYSSGRVCGCWSPLPLLTSAKVP